MKSSNQKTTYLYVKDPWPYAIADNFLSAEHFAELLEYGRGVRVDSGQKIFFSHKVSRGGTIIQCDLFQPEFLFDLFHSYASCFNEYLRLARPSKCWLTSYYDISLQISGPEFEDKIHLDVPRKLVSGVVYLCSGDCGLGTLLYNTKGEPNSEVIVPWEENRAVLFCRDQGTYHSYRGNGDCNRMTLVYNVCTSHHSCAKQIDKVRGVFHGIRVAK